MYKSSSGPRGCQAPAVAARGFSLIELMVVVLIVAILSTLALSGYRKYTLRAHRSAAISFMYEVAGAQERYMTDNRAFADNLSDLGELVPSEVSDNYTIATAASAGPPPNFTITATPHGGQLQDAGCGTLTLNGNGDRTPSNASSCWK